MSGTTNQILHHQPRRPARPLDEGSNAALMLIEEVRRNTAAIEKLARLFDAWADASLNAKYKFGRPTDRWAPRP